MVEVEHSLCVCLDAILAFESAFGGTWLPRSSTLKLILTSKVDMYLTTLDRHYTNFPSSPSVVSSFRIFTSHAIFTILLCQWNIVSAHSL